MQLMWTGKINQLFKQLLWLNNSIKILIHFVWDWKSGILGIILSLLRSSMIIISTLNLFIYLKREKILLTIWKNRSKKSFLMMKKLSKSLMLLRYLWDRICLTQTAIKSECSLKNVYISLHSENLSLSIWNKEWMQWHQIYQLLLEILLVLNLFLMLEVLQIFQNILHLLFKS